MNNDRLPPGKLSPSLLKSLLGLLPLDDQTLIIPPGSGLDAAGILLDKKLLAVTTDPITFSTQRLGTYSVCVNINDIACMGAKPRWYTSNLLLPLGTTKTTLRTIWNDLVEQLKKYDIAAIGGHIEVTPAVNTPILVGQMIGEALLAQLLTPQKGQPGDRILLCQAPAIEGTALLATEKQKELQAHFSKESLLQMQQLIENPGICILSMAKKITHIKGLVAMHDPTEGGLANALHELADAACCGLTLDYDAISLRDDTRRLSQYFHIDPLGLLASGSLLILCEPEAEPVIHAQLKNEGIETIGQLTEESTRQLNKNGKLHPLPRFLQDEIIKVL